jgi:hypothetical protein
MGAIVWKKTEQDSWSGSEGSTHLGDIESSADTYHLVNSVGTELGDFATMGEAQRQLVADRRPPTRDRVTAERAWLQPGDDLLDIHTIAPDLARVQLDRQTVGFVRRVDPIFVALSGPTLHLAVEVGQFYSIGDAVRCIRSSPRL